MGPASALPKRVGRLAAGAGVVAIGMSTLALDYATSSLTATTYAQQTTAAEVLFLAAGTSLALAGMLASLSRPGTVGDLALLGGLVWFAPAWVGWDLGPPVVRTLAMVASAFLVPVALHLLLAFPSQHVRPPAARTWVVACYLGIGAGELSRLLFWEPFFDPGCWANCTDNVLLVHAAPDLANAIEAAERLVVVVAALLLAVFCIGRIASRQGSPRRVVLPVAVPGLLFAVAFLAHAFAVLRVRVEDPSDPLLMAVFLASCIAVVGLGLGLMSEALRTVAQRRALARIVVMLSETPVPGALETALAGVVGDADLRISYWLADPDRYVDAAGAALPDPAETPGRTLTAVVQDGRRVAVVSHSTDPAELENQLGPAVRLGLENERLQVESLARLEELRASRARIVETGDAERLRLERDLHDGAQQDLVALSYEIRLGLAAAESGGESRTRELLEQAVAEALAALDDLRELAHGIYPAVLATSGLGPALAGLADTAPLYVVLQATSSERFRDPVEMGAYILVREAVDDAAQRGATQAVVKVVRESAQLVVTVDDDGADRSSDPVRLADRVVALGGTLAIEPRSLRGEIPCV